MGAAEASPGLAAGVRALAGADLETLLRRRPEAAGPGSGRAGEVAAALARPAGVARAAGQLNRFLLQLLQLGCVAGGRLTPEVAGAEGLAAGLLEEGAHELARWGLAFPTEDGGLTVPPEVGGRVPRPAGVGPAAASLLRRLPVDALLPVARHLGVAGEGAAARKTALVAALAARLADRELVRRLAGVAPEGAGRALAAIRAAGGRAGRPAPAPASGAGIAAPFAWRPDHPAGRDGLPWLASRGLLLPAGPGADLVVPGEVEWALRGRLFDGWPARPPRLEPAPLSGPGHPGDLVAAAEALLDAWRLDPPELLRQGGLPARAARRTVAVLGVGEDEAHLLHLLAVGAGLAGVAVDAPAGAARERRLLAPTREAERWRRLPAAGRWSALFEVWLAERVGRADAMPAGWLLLRTLADLPAGRGASAESVARALAWRHPARFAGVEDAGDLVERLGAELAFLGAGTAAPVAGLTALGRAAVAGRDAGALASAFPEPAAGGASGPWAAARRRPRLQVGRAGFYVRGEDPAALAAIVASRRLRPLRPRLVAPTIALLEAESLEHLVRELRRAGAAPAAEGVAAPAHVGRAVLAPRRARRPREAAPGDAGGARLVALLAGLAPAPAPGAGTEERPARSPEPAPSRGGIIEVDFAARRR